MARELEEIQNQILDKIAQEPTLAFINNSSKASYFQRIVYVVAYMIWIHEAIVEENNRRRRLHNFDYDKQRALDYQDGVDIIWSGDRGQFEFAPVENPEQRKLVKRCAVGQGSEGEIVIKVAGEQNGELQPLPDDVMVRFQTYMEETKGSGDVLYFVNRPADLLKVEVDVYVDALQLDLDTGKLLSSNEENYPAKEAIYNYLAQLEFNGAFVKQKFENSIEAARGVEIVDLKVLQWKYGGFDYSNVDLWQIPDAGYFKIEDLKINYIKYHVGNR